MPYDMKATITIDGLKLWARHGVMPQERAIGNDFVVSVSLDYPPALQAVNSDRVAETLNYARAIDIIKDVMAEPSELIEHVAGRIHRALLDEFPLIASGRITVAKLAPPVAAEIEAVSFTLVF